MDLHRYHFKLLSIGLVVIGISCKKEVSKPINLPKEINQIVVVSVNAPEKYEHFVAQDSIGKKITDTSGPKAIITRKGFSYVDHMNNEKLWSPKPNTNDTLIVESTTDYLELSSQNFFSLIEDSFLLQKGDTVIITYNNSIPTAKIKNRTVNDVELNYNKYRLQKLFDNKYSSHFLVFGNLIVDGFSNDFERKSLDFYSKSKTDYAKELSFLDSLLQTNNISKVNYNYRKDALNMLMEKHKENKIIKEWLNKNQTLEKKEDLKKDFAFDYSNTDSLMRFSFFRDYLKQVSKYELNTITVNRGGSGSSFIDHRIRFDSILNDRRFNQTAKNYLLFDAFMGIGQNFKTEDKEKYFEKLQNHTTNRVKLEEFQDTYNLDFSKTDKLILTTKDSDTTNYATVLATNKGKWLYIDFWASWCKPCRENMPASATLKSELTNENIEFIYISMYDKKENWFNAMKRDGIFESQNYFIENGNVSKVTEDLNIETIPHYLIYDPQGNLVNGYANRPTDGAKEQLKSLLGI